MPAIPVLGWTPSESRAAGGHGCSSAALQIVEAAFGVSSGRSQQLPPTQRVNTRPFSSELAGPFCLNQSSHCSVTPKRHNSAILESKKYVAYILAKCRWNYLWQANKIMLDDKFNTICSNIAITGQTESGSVRRYLQNSVRTPQSWITIHLQNIHPHKGVVQIMLLFLLDTCHIHKLCLL